MPKKPVVVCFPFVGDNIGGSHISAAKLVRGLDPKRIRPLVALHRIDGKLAPFLDKQGLDFVSAPDIEILSPKSRRVSEMSRRTTAWTNLAKTAPQLRRFLKLHGVEVVHTNDGRIHATWAFASRVAGAKLLWHHRGDPDARGVNILAPLLANHIVTVSRFACPRRPILPVAHRLSVVHSPFDHPVSVPNRAEARDALVSELGCSAETGFLGYFGNFVDRKRPVAFVEAVNAYIQQHPDIPVAGVLFGELPPDGPPLDVAVRSRASELGIADRIHLMGFRHPVEPWICSIDILLVPAVNEPFGRTLIEAMLLGTPVIATDHGGNPEAIRHGENGFLVEADKPEAFVLPIHHLLSDPECWHRISDTARRQALSSFSLDIHVERMTEIYERMVGRLDK